MVRDVFENQVIRLPDGDAAYLRRLLGGFLEARADGWAVTRCVGHVALPSGATLRVRSPKAGAASILAWAGYVDPRLHDLRFLGTLPEATDPNDFGEVLARTFVEQTLLAAVRNGLVRQYRSALVRTATLRGRIEFTALARTGGILSTIPCTVWQRLSETPLNQTLAAALRVISSDSVMAASCRDRLPELRALLGGIQARIDARIASGRHPLPRNERPFEIACALARLLLRDDGLSEGSRLPGPAFLVNLESLFERAVAKGFREAGVPCSPSWPVPYMSLGSTSLAARPGPEQMVADVFVPDLDGQPVVIDAKYKGEHSSANLQQVVTYCYALGVEKACLILPANDDHRTRTFRFTGKNLTRGDRSSKIDVSIVGLRVDGTSVEGWRKSSLAMVERVREATRAE